MTARRTAHLALALLSLTAHLACTGKTEHRLTAVSETDAVEPRQASLTRVEPDVSLGFNHAYYLHVPSVATVDHVAITDDHHGAPRYLLVEPNNTGTVSDDPEVHDKEARRLIERIARDLGTPLGVPVLVPVFPRPESRWRIYTHALDRDSLLETEGDLVRLDLQLLAMIDHAREQLESQGLTMDEQVLLNGFSASGTFVNRFTALHPERVRAVACGGLNALPILPLSHLDDHDLGYPIGIANLEALTGRAFQHLAWSQVPQYLYMGELDENDTLPFGDAWDDDERAVIAAALGESMQPERWQRMQGLLESSGASIHCVTYQGIGHEINRQVHEDLRAFFARHMEISHTS